MFRCSLARTSGDMATASNFRPDTRDRVGSSGTAFDCNPSPSTNILSGMSSPILCAARIVRRLVYLSSIGYAVGCTRWTTMRPLNAADAVRVVALDSSDNTSFISRVHRAPRRLVKLRNTHSLPVSDKQSRQGQEPDRNSLEDRMSANFERRSTLSMTDGEVRNLSSNTPPTETPDPLAKPSELWSLYVCPASIVASIWRRKVSRTV